MPTMRDALAAGGRVVGSTRGGGDAVEIAAYDPAWVTRYELMRGRLAAALGPVALRIEHAGSTSIPGLAAKPIVDIQVSVPDVNDEEAFVAPIERLGFELRFVEHGHRYFRPPSGLPRDFQ